MIGTVWEKVIHNLSTKKLSYKQKTHCNFIYHQVFYKHSNLSMEYLNSEIDLLLSFEASIQRNHKQMKEK